MLYMNITNPKRKPYSDRFQYLNSKVGSKFPVDVLESFGNFKIRYDQLLLELQYGNFINVGEYVLEIVTSP